jgi:hypothetical protein
MMSENPNMKLFELMRSTPHEARKPITGGRLKGFTDINPMWRMKRLTEVFGPCGIGWKYEIVSQRIQPGHGNEVAAFVDILLYYKQDGKWSEGIPGVGGSSFVAVEKNGAHTSDECFKMALTDAIGTACKALGMSADIFYEKDRTKYTTNQEPDPQKKNPVDEAAAMVIDIAPYAGMTLGEIWKTDLNFVKWLRDEPSVHQCIKDAIQVINSNGKKA